MTRNHLLFVLRLLLTFGFMLLATRSMPDKVDWTMMADMGTTALVASMLLALLLVVVLGWRWHRLLQAKRHESGQFRPSLASCTLLIWLGLAINQVLPSIVGGDAARAGLLARAGIPLRDAVMSVFVDRLIGLAGLLLICLASSSYLFSYGIGLSLALISAALVTAGLARLVLHWARRQMPKLASALDLLGRISPCELSLLTVAAVAGHLLSFAVFLMIAGSLGLDVPVLQAIALLGIVSLAAIFPVSIAGWGIREVTLVNGLAALSLPADRVFVASVIYGGIMFMVQVPGLLVFLKKQP